MRSERIGASLWRRQQIYSLERRLSYNTRNKSKLSTCHPQLCWISSLRESADDFLPLSSLKSTAIIPAWRRGVHFKCRKSLTMGLTWKNRERSEIKYLLFGKTNTAEPSFLTNKLIIWTQTPLHRSNPTKLVVLSVIVNDNNAMVCRRP